MQTDERSAQVPISESDVIGLLNRWVADAGGVRADEIGIGDDAAIARFDDSHIVLTSDAMVDGVHFLSGSMSWHDVGWKCVVSNQSDIAAMGALPENALLTLAMPSGISKSELDGILSGVIGALDRFGGRLVGGDTVSSSVAMISVSMTGRLVNTGKPLTRGSAQVGQLIAVTGPLGASAGGLAVLKDSPEQPHGANGTGQRARVIEAHTRPSPRTDLAPEMVRSGVECAMDVSDGLLIDLERICAASGVDAVIHADAVPNDPDVSALFPQEALELALTGGEDYELLYVADAETIARVNASQPITVVGEFGVVGEIKPREGAEPKVTVLDSGGNELAFATKGWDHFAQQFGDVCK